VAPKWLRPLFWAIFCEKEKLAYPLILSRFASFLPQYRLYFLEKISELSTCTSTIISELLKYILKNEN